MNDGIIISSKGINGSTMYFGLTAKGERPILSNLNLQQFSDGIIRTYPEYSAKILKFYESGFSGNFPTEINVSKLDPNHRAKLIETISEKLRKPKKV